MLPRIKKMEGQKKTEIEIIDVYLHNELLDRYKKVFTRRRKFFLIIKFKGARKW